MALSREVSVCLRASLITMLARPRHTLLIAFGLLVAGITLVVLLTIPAGLRRLAGQTGLSDVVIVLPNGATDESSGTLGAGFAGLVGSLPGVAHSRDGHPLVAAQFVVNTRLRRHDGTTATVLVRGVTPTFWNVIGESVAMRSGRHFRAGTDELISGVAAASSFVSADAGATVLLHAKPWHVSGEFTAEGGFWESELWADLAALQATYNAQGTLTCIWVKLDSPDMFSTFSKALHDDPRTAGLYATRQRDYYTSQTAFLEWFIQVAAEGIAVALGLGAALAIINALSMALDARKRDLAILRALGFRRRALATALLVEVLLNGILCTGISLVLGWLMVDGREIGSSTFSSAIQFKMHIDVNVVVWTLIYLLLLSALSALWPIVRAVRAPLTHALQRE